MIDVATRVEDLIRDLVESEGLELVHVEYEPGGGSPVLRVYIDQEGGVNISHCAEISRKASLLLDIEDFIPNQYVLEVSSPGIERPLFKEEDYRKFQGKEVRLTTREKIQNRRKFTGTIREVSEGFVTLVCDGEPFQIPFENIKRANLVYRFD